MLQRRTFIFAGLSISGALSGCGVLLHPERRGQGTGRIDPLIAILDGVGLVLFMVPGLVAITIDFHQGTIYLPRSAAKKPRNDQPNTPPASNHDCCRSKSNEREAQNGEVKREDTRLIQIKGSISAVIVEDCLEKACGQRVTLQDHRLKAYRLAAPLA